LLARHAAGTIACTIEGKVDEPFGPTVTEEMANASAGQQERMRYLCAMLGLTDCLGHVRYQLHHRTVSALIEGDRFHAADAAMIVHSFSPERRWFADFAAFVELLGGAVEEGRPAVVGGLSKRLILGWACGDQAFRLA